MVNRNRSQNPQGNPPYDSNPYLDPYAQQINAVTPGRNDSIYPGQNGYIPSQKIWASGEPIDPPSRQGSLASQRGSPAIYEIEQQHDDVVRNESTLYWILNL